MVMVKWPIHGFIFFGLLAVVAKEAYGRNFGDVDGEDVAIDNIEEFYGNKLNGQPLHEEHQQLKAGSQRLQQQIKPEKIDFAVGPRDPRFHYTVNFLRGEPEPNGAHQRFGEDPNYPIYTNEYARPKPQYPHFFPKQNQLKNYFYQSYPDYGTYNKPVGDSPNRGSLPREHFPVNEVVNPHLLHSGIPASRPDGVSYLQQAKQYAEPGSYVERGYRPTEALSEFYFVATVIGCTVAAISIVVGAGICYYRLSKSKREAADAEYPAYGVTGPSKDISPGAADRKLAQSAHMYHYQHQKQQMIAIEKTSGDDRHCSASDVDSEEEEVPDYTVYECPGLAPTDNMEVKNPLFNDDPTPATPVVNTPVLDQKNDE